MKYLKSQIYQLSLFLLLILFSSCYDSFEDMGANNYQISNTPHYLRSQISSLFFGNEASSSSIIISAEENTSWIISSSSSWLTVTPASGIGNKNITVSVLKNTSGDEERNCFLTVRSTDPDYPREFKIEITQSKFIETDSKGHPFVDLGLTSGTLWAMGDVGMENETHHYSYEETKWGDYYSSIWTANQYKWMDASNKLTKYCTKSIYGSVDNKTELDLSDDVAHFYWGGKIPSQAQFQELKDECTWTWSDKTWPYGYEVKSKKNGKSIFLSTSTFYQNGSYNGSNRGRYWSCSLDTDNNKNAYILYFDKDEIDTKRSNSRLDGLHVRAVMRRGETR